MECRLGPSLTAFLQTPVKLVSGSGPPEEDDPPGKRFGHHHREIDHHIHQAGKVLAVALQLVWF